MVSTQPAVSVRYKTNSERELNGFGARPGMKHAVATKSQLKARPGDWGGTERAFVAGIMDCQPCRMSKQAAEVPYVGAAGFIRGSK